MKKTKTIATLTLLITSLLSMAAHGAPNKPEQAYFSVEDLEGKRVGVAIGYGADVTVTEMGIFKISRYLNNMDMPVALKAGNIEAFATERSAAESMIAETPGLAMLPEPMKARLFRSSARPAAAKAPCFAA